ncbi:rhomboid family intramembrane serine protease [Streptosporangium sp. NPDC000239]|uniref:rhomboid family intramembrane serine protease n=1 Tax=Streptosporangium sp. NPDC000239 TaxID=3154248 RepID=UPI0033253EDF
MSKPWLTWTTFAVTAVTTTAGLLLPGLSALLARSPGLLDGQWWRLLSPILVNPEGWYQILFNGAALLLLGTYAERAYGRARWLLLYLGGALAGEVYSYAVGDYSAGSSVAIAGLLGGLAVWVVRGHSGLPRRPRIAAAALLAGAVVLALIGDEHGAPILTGALIALVLPARAAGENTAHAR